MKVGMIKGKRRNVLSLGAFFLALALVSSLPLYETKAETPLTDSGACGDGVSWEYYEQTGALHIFGNGEMQTYNEEESPWYGYREEVKSVTVAQTVTRISAGAFYGCNHVEEMTIPFVGGERLDAQTDAAKRSDGRTFVFGYVFGWVKTGVSIPPSAPNTVYQCYSDENYLLLESGKNSYFNGYEADYFYVPSTIEKVTVTGGGEIGSGAFQNCKNVKEIHLADGISTIGHHAFYNCVNVTGLRLPESVEKIEKFAFSKTVHLYIPDVDYLKTYCEKNEYTFSILPNESSSTNSSVESSSSEENTSSSNESSSSSSEESSSSSSESSSSSSEESSSSSSESSSSSSSNEDSNNESVQISSSSEQVHSSQEETSSAAPSQSSNETKEEKGKVGLAGVIAITASSVAVAGTGGFSLFWFVIKKRTWADLVAFFKKL